jgi:hypothetical protein
MALRNAATYKTLAISGPTASNPIDVRGVVVATCIVNTLKDKYRIYTKAAGIPPQ